MNYELSIEQLWIMNYELWIGNYELWIMNYELIKFALLPLFLYLCTDKQQHPWNHSTPTSWPTWPASPSAPCNDGWPHVAPPSSSSATVRRTSTSSPVPSPTSAVSSASTSDSESPVTLPNAAARTKKSRSGIWEITQQHFPFIPAAILSISHKAHKVHKVPFMWDFHIWRGFFTNLGASLSFRRRRNLSPILLLWVLVGLCETSQSRDLHFARWQKPFVGMTSRRL